MGARRTQPRIIRRRDHVATLNHGAQTLDLLENKDRERRRAARHDPGSRMRPGNDRATAGWRWTLRHDDDARNQDRLVVQPGRAIQHAIGRSAKRRAVDRLLPDERAGSTSDGRWRRPIERCLCHCGVGKPKDNAEGYDQIESAAVRKQMKRGAAGCDNAHEHHSPYRIFSSPLA